MADYYILQNNCPICLLRAYPTLLNAKLALSSPH